MKKLFIFILAAYLVSACEPLDFEPVPNPDSNDTTATIVDTTVVDTTTPVNLIAPNIFMPVPSLYGFGARFKSTSEDSVFTIEEQTFDPLPDSLTDELVLYYPFDNGVVNESQVDLYAQLSGGDFNETNNYITVDSDTALNFDTTFTIAVWFNNNGMTSDLAQNMVSKWLRCGNDFGNVGYALEYRNDVNNVTMIEFHNVFDVAPGKRAANSCQYYSSDLSLGWHLIVVTYDENVKMYIDNVLVCNSEWGVAHGGTGYYYSGEYDSDNIFIDGQIVNNNEPVYIGGENSTYWQEHYFYGALDNIMLFDRSLPESHVSALYNLRQQ